MWHDAFICVVSLFHICSMTHSYACCTDTHDSFINVAWRIHMCGITLSYMLYDSSICVLHARPWLIHICGMTHSYVRYHFSWLIHKSTESNPESWEATSHSSMSRFQWYHTHEKRPTLIKRDPYSCKETYSSQKRPIMTHSYVWYHSDRNEPLPPGGGPFLCMFNLKHREEEEPTNPQHQISKISTAYCIWSVVSSISNLNWCSRSLGLFCHVPSTRDKGDRVRRLRLNEWHSKCDRLYQISKISANIWWGPLSPPVTWDSAKVTWNSCMWDTPRCHNTKFHKYICVHICVLYIIYIYIYMYIYETHHKTYQTHVLRVICLLMIYIIYIYIYIYI